jgi:hypothetical protein
MILSEIKEVLIKVKRNKELKVQSSSHGESEKY